VTGNMIEHGFNDMRLHSDVRHTSCNGARNVMDTVESQVVLSQRHDLGQSNANCGILSSYITGLRHNKALALDTRSYIL
jgi:hypothetical protein